MMLKLGYASKSLNRILDHLPVELQEQIKQWWGKKLLIAYALAGFSFIYGIFIGSSIPFIISLLPKL